MIPSTSTTRIWVSIPEAEYNNLQIRATQAHAGALCLMVIVAAESVALGLLTLALAHTWGHI